MATKKVRTPPPPVRRVQAPKKRVEPRARPVPGGRTSYWLAGLLGIVVVVGIVLGIVLSKGSGGSSVSKVEKLAAAAGGTFQIVPATQSALHIPNFKTTVTYNSYPPTSGKHYFTPAVWNDYSEPVDPRQAVHNEEHGGIVIWYGPKTSPETIQQIGNFYNESTNAMLVTPLENSTPGAKFPPHQPLGSKIAFTAWNGTSAGGHGYVMILPRFDEAAAKAFRDAFRGKGPERFPVSLLKQGT